MSNHCSRALQSRWWFDWWDVLQRRFRRRLQDRRSRVQRGLPRPSPNYRQTSQAKPTSQAIQGTPKIGPAKGAKGESQLGLYKWGSHFRSQEVRLLSYLSFCLVIIPPWFRPIISLNKKESVSESLLLVIKIIQNDIPFPSISFQQGIHFPRWCSHGSFMALSCRGHRSAMPNSTLQRRCLYFIRFQNIHPGRLSLETANSERIRSRVIFQRTLYS